MQLFGIMKALGGLLFKYQVHGMYTKIINLYTKHLNFIINLCISYDYIKSQCKWMTWNDIVGEWYEA